MESDLNDIVSPSQSSPSMVNVGQKANSSADPGNATLVNVNKFPMFFCDFYTHDLAGSLSPFSC